MRIAIIRRKFSFHGGAENMVTKLALALSGAGHDVYILANQWDKTGDIKIINVPMLTLGSFLKTLTFAISAYILCRKYKFDVVLSNEKTIFQDIYRAGDGCHKEWLKQRGRYAGIFTKFLQYINPFHLLILYLEKGIMKNSKKIIANSTRVKEELKMYYNIPQEKVSVVYNPVDSSKYSELEKGDIRKKVRTELCIKETDTIFLFVGSGFERKGLKYFLEALKRADDDSFHAVILGKGRPIKNIYNNVSYLGIDPRPDRYYYSSDALVLPVIYDPFPNAVLEAMSFCLPVITTKICGASEIIKDGENGFIIPEASEIDILSKKIKILKDPAIRSRMGRNAKDTVSKFTLDKAVRETEAIIK